MWVLSNRQCIHVYLARSIALAEIPPILQEVELKRHKLDGLDPKELAELTRKCHLFGSIDLSGWKGVSLLSFRSLCLAVGGSLQTVSLRGERCHALPENSDQGRQLLIVVCLRLWLLWLPTAVRTVVVPRPSHSASYC